MRRGASVIGNARKYSTWLEVHAIHIFERLNQHVFRLSRGRIGGSLLGYPVLLLTCKGRKTGKLRSHMLIYMPDGADFVVVASNNGQDRHPQWYLNLRAHPFATVNVRGSSFPVVASLATPEERSRLWPRLVWHHRLWACHQRRTSREIPVVILRRAAPRESG